MIGLTISPLLVQQRPNLYDTHNFKNLSLFSFALNRERINVAIRRNACSNFGAQMHGPSSDVWLLRYTPSVTEGNLPQGHSSKHVSKHENPQYMTTPHPKFITINANAMCKAVFFCSIFLSKNKVLYRQNPITKEYNQNIAGINYLPRCTYHLL